MHEKPGEMAPFPFNTHVQFIIRLKQKRMFGVDVGVDFLQTQGWPICRSSAVSRNAHADDIK